jgi:hypothetical protein
LLEIAGTYQKRYKQQGNGQQPSLPAAFEHSGILKQLSLAGPTQSPGCVGKFWASGIGGMLI